MDNTNQNYEVKVSIKKSSLDSVWVFWQKSKWYLALIFIITISAVYYQKNIGKLTFAVALLLAFIFIIVCIVFNDNQGLVGNAVPFAVDPLPPHLGLDGISNEIRFVN
jgi:hypothetical protein